MVRRCRRDGGYGGAFGLGRTAQGTLQRTLQTLSYVPLAPPNVAGYPKGPRLLDPHRLIHTFDLVGLVPKTIDNLSTDEVLLRLGLFDVSEQSRSVLDQTNDIGTRIALAVNSPEYHVV